jgi:hypothetical protein
MLTHLVSIPFSEMPHVMSFSETHWVSQGKRENKNPLIFTLCNTLGHGHDQSQTWLLVWALLLVVPKASSV